MSSTGCLKRTLGSNLSGLEGIYHYENLANLKETVEPEMRRQTLSVILPQVANT